MFLVMYFFNILVGLVNRPSSNYFYYFLDLAGKPNLCFYVKVFCYLYILVFLIH